MNPVLPEATSRSLPAKNGNDNTVALERAKATSPRPKTPLYGSIKRKIPNSLRKLDALIGFFSPSSKNGLRATGKKIQK